MQSANILVTCPKACSKYLAAELDSLGYTVTKEAPAGVFTNGTIEDCIRLNLQLRTGLRVLWQVANFRARNAEALYRRASKLPWETWIPDDGYFSIVSSIRNDTIRNTGFANLKLKDAIVDKIRKETGRRPDSGNDSDKASVFLYWKEEDVHLYLDTSGKPISNRGYRVSPWKAPMRENLAASVIDATRWDKQSPFINPMCGSGTLAIEAALLAKRQTPNLLRDNFAFMHLVGFEPWKYAQLRTELSDTDADAYKPRIIATDIDPDAIEAAQRNAEIAGVGDLIDFKVCDFLDTEIPSEPGVIILNPEYGERLGEEEALVETYQKIGDLFKQKAQGYWGYVFTGNMNLGKRVGLKTKRKIEFYNGPIECRLLEYELYAGSKR